MIKAYPLQWPQGWPRTEYVYRQQGRFGKKEHAAIAAAEAHKGEA